MTFKEEEEFPVIEEKLSTIKASKKITEHRENSHQWKEKGCQF